MKRISVICEPRWKWISCSQCARPADLRRSITCMSCAEVRPNLDFSPPDCAQRPEPSLESLMRTPMVGSIPIWAATCSSTSSSLTCSITMITV